MESIAGAQIRYFKLSADEYDAKILTSGSLFFSLKYSIKNSPQIIDLSDMIQSEQNVFDRTIKKVYV